MHALHGADAVAQMSVLVAALRESAYRAEQRGVRAEARLREREMFLAEAAHMLKTPLTVILSCAELLGEAGEQADPGRGAMVAVLARNAAQLAHQVDRLLEESAAEVHSYDVHPVDLDLAEAAAATLAPLRGAARGHRLHAPHGPPAWARADPHLLEHVLAHLVDNAVKYSPPGSPIELDVHQAGAWAEIEVTDHGIGLPEGIDAFAPFRRGPARAVQDATAQDTPGVGLGLHIVRTLTRAMGGEVSAASNSDGGTTFTVRLPTARTRPPTPAASCVPAPRGPRSPEHPDPAGRPGDPGPTP